MGDWDSGQYMKFASERTQPSVDLINRIVDISPAKIIDLGCGPGNSTIALKNRFKNADILGVDASDDMLKKAEKSYPDIKFKKCLLPGGLAEEEGKYGLVFSNACIQWIPEQEELFERVREALTVGGVFACQIPMVQNAPFYHILHELIESGRWEFLKDTDTFHNLNPEEYYDLLSCNFTSFNMWETVYYHFVPSAEGVIEWYSGSGLRPYLDRLNESEKEEFLGDLRQRVNENYPTRRDGRVILKMPRLFFTAIK